MKIANTVRAAGPGVLAGALAGLLLNELGILACLPGGISATAAVVALSLAGAILGTFRRTKILSIATGFLLGAYLIVALTPLTRIAARRWVRDDTPGKAIVAVIALSSGILANSQLEEHGLDRLLTSAEVAQATPTARLLTTRIRMHTGGRTIVSDSGQREMVRLAGLESRWLVIDSVFTTRDEALRARRLFPPDSQVRIAVVTSPMHTRRACAVFEKAGFDVRCVAAREHTAVTDDPHTPHDRLAAFREYLYERLGWIKYRARGWVAYSSR